MTKFNYFFIILRLFWPPLLFFFFLFYFLFLSYQERHFYIEFQRKMQNIPVFYAQTALNPSNQNINLAMSLFSIEQDDGVSHPLYASHLEARGVIIGDLFFSKKKVYIGNDAFQSWGVLGSTLAHEIEVHGYQSFCKIELQNQIYKIVNILRSYLEEIPLEMPYFKYGSYLAEREAYLFEIEFQKRFGLTNKETKGILFTLEHDLPRDFNLKT